MIGRSALSQKRSDELATLVGHYASDDFGAMG